MNQLWDTNMSEVFLFEPNRDELVGLYKISKIDSIGAVATGIAHDFNNLLTPVILVMDEMRRSPQLSIRQSGKLGDALACAERAQRLVQRLLNFTHTKPMIREALDIVEVVNAMRELFVSFLAPKVFLELEFAPDLPLVMIDRDQIETALLNLIINARDAMPDGGKITMSAAVENIMVSEAGFLNASSMMRLSVSDTGSGMTSDTLERAVDPFFSTKGIGKGTGLGLALVCATVKELGGQFSIMSKIGCGTTVEMRLPVA
jgi:signal transduction histidine kinase